MKQKRMKKSVVALIVTVVTVGILAGAMGLFLYFFQTPSVVISEQRRYPVGTKVSLSDLVLEVQYGTLENEEEIFEAQKAGETTVVLFIRDRLGLTREESFTLEFYDEAPPVIHAPTLTFSITEGESIDFLSGVTATDNTGAPCTVRVDGEYDFNTPGLYTLRYIASDHTGNAVQKEFTLEVKKLVLPFDENGKLIEGVYKTKKGFTIEVKGGIAYAEGHLIVNKSYALPKEYKLGDRTLTAETSNAWNAMRNAAAKDGIYLSIRSGTRDWNDQSWIFSGYVRNDGVEKAETYSARPGHSEHQSGYGMDILTSSSEDIRNGKYAAEMKWLNDNAYKYGFVLRYPEGKSDETGYIYEAWHYRYVGEELAETLYNNGDWITIEAYFGIDSVYRGYDKQ